MSREEKQFSDGFVDDKMFVLKMGLRWNDIQRGEGKGKQTVLKTQHNCNCEISYVHRATFINMEMNYYANVELVRAKWI